MSMQVEATGVFCYKDESQYHEFLNIFTDAQGFPATFEEWEQLNEKLIQKTESSGVIVVRAYAESTNSFVDFCRRHEKGVNSEGRRYFASAKAADYLRSR
ncbi:hypothetical protein [Xenorhabdus griffiniae]|uniref:hypothetical protein n=1 Tax=Xenorhabdus griffiniae TaxID=351672 RepID=UPI0023590CFD|nr:hypothetical protein [Xenorhabdus griffiniae]MDC9607246.1 hypothetical protein [Xenorhabdus griffiniae]